MIVNFVGDIWGFPLGTLLDRLLARDYPPPFEYEPDGELRGHRPENGHAVAALAIVAAIIEAHIRYAVAAKEGPKAAEGDRVREMLNVLLLPSAELEPLPTLVDEATEVLWVRNAVLHGNLWSIERGRWRTDRALARPPRIVAQRLVGRGKLAIDEDGRLPKTGMNLIPTWVDVDDVIIALAIAVDVIDQLERRGYQATPVVVPLGGTPRPLAVAAFEFEAAIRARDSATPQ
jgi:hypothetical protein